MNTTTKPVVIGIVDKQPSALRFAIREARAILSPLRVIHSVGTPPQAAQFYAGYGVLEGLQAAGQAILDDAKRFIDEEAPGLRAEYILTTVAPVAALEREASTARILILGADDVPWYDRLLRTKVAGYLARHAACPVVVVPELSYPGTFEGDVILTLDGDTSADGPIAFAFEEACARDSVLHILHATPPEALSSDEDETRANIAEVLAGWREKFPEIIVVETFTAGEPEATLTRATEIAGLVIIGRPHGESARFAMARPVAIEVLKEAHCPVAVVPASYRGA